MFDKQQTFLLVHIYRPNSVISAQPTKRDENKCIDFKQSGSENKDESKCIDFKQSGSKEVHSASAQSSIHLAVMVDSAFLKGCSAIKYLPSFPVITDTQFNEAKSDTEKMLELRRQPTIGFSLLGAHQLDAVSWKHHKREIQLGSGTMHAAVTHTTASVFIIFKPHNYFSLFDNELLCCKVTTCLALSSSKNVASSFRCTQRDKAIKPPVR
ncbi:hypothetical protein T265_04437 [Opisthorchis viverrini]|uniref:Uncharacterized protein n=1 Tax=Opisthorchis viverrini TaxID=6198 RepID=A0A074ZNZ2_OPIVI|nr:hypothetical protein T265_04437 [Opisthorchis viverrini]KER28831.1 hypothetical protein T265_04437 [Opisthorchis viverrini]